METSTAAQPATLESKMLGLVQTILQDPAIRELAGEPLDPESMFQSALDSVAAMKRLDLAKQELDQAQRNYEAVETENRERFRFTTPHRLKAIRVNADRIVRENPLQITDDPNFLWRHRQHVLECITKILLDNL